MMLPPCNNNGNEERGVSIDTDRGDLERGYILEVKYS